MKKYDPTRYFLKGGKSEGLVGYKGIEVRLGTIDAPTEFISVTTKGDRKSIKLNPEAEAALMEDIRVVLRRFVDRMAMSSEEVSSED